ncbi:MAG: cytochrome P450 [Myxococcales bacterium]|nr:cytochrome P450 [Myxococcales bacterium]
MSLPPGSRLPATAQTYLLIKHFCDFSTFLHMRYGDIFTIQLLGIGPSVHVARPDLIRELFIASTDVVHAGDSNKVIEPLVGKTSVALVDGDPHQRVRRLLNGPLHGSRMKKHGPTMVDATVKAISSWKAGEQRSMLTLMQDVSLEIILRAIFGVSDSALPEAASNVLKMVLAYTAPLVIVPWTRVDLGPWSPFGRFARRRAVVHDWLDKEITDRRHNPDPDRADVLSALVLGREGTESAFTDEEIRDQLITLFVAGQDTTSAALTWAMVLLHANQGILEKLVAEVDSLGPDPDPDALAELPYLTAVCQESLRCTTTVPAASRTPFQKPWSIGGYDVPPGVYVSPNIFLIHHDPSIYPEPFRFRPERFQEKEYTPYEFMPFGGGARRCIGMALSLYEMRIVLGTLLRHLRFSALTPGVSEHIWRGMVMVPENQGTLRVTERRIPVSAKRVAA